MCYSKLTRHVDELGVEFWEARELMKVLKYVDWRKFKNAIEKAKNACEVSNNEVLDHFVCADKMISLAKGAVRKAEDYKLSRNACYKMEILEKEK